MGFNDRWSPPKGQKQASEPESTQGAPPEWKNPRYSRQDAAGDWNTAHLSDHNHTGIRKLVEMRDHPGRSPIVQTAKPSFRDIRAREISEWATQQLRLVEDYRGEAL